MFTFLLVSLFLEASMMISPVQARVNILERDGRAVYMRRLGLNPPVLDELRATCAGICDALASSATNALLANAGECEQQDVADKLIDVARAQKDSKVTDNLISLAIEYRETEKNTPADDTISPPVFRNSVYCQKAPKNPELKGLVQSQAPENDPNAFFDPAKPDKTIKLGDQPNTFHFDAVEDDSCDPTSDPTNGDQNGGNEGGNDDGGAGGNNDDGAGGDDNNGAGGSDDDGGDDGCDDDGESGGGQQPGDGEGDDDDCDDDSQHGSGPQAPDSPDGGKDTGSGSGNSGGGYGGGNSGQDGGAPGTAPEQPAEAPGGYRTGTASAPTPVPTLTQSSEASASSSADPKVTSSTTPPAPTPRHTSSVASSSTPTATTSLSSSPGTSISPSITPTPTTVPTTPSTSSASATPTASGPSAVLLANGKAAQAKNAASTKNPLKDGDPCVGSEVACLGGNVDLGICTQGKFKTFSCATSGGSCFAVPQTSATGISSTCITQSDALRLIAASGAGNSLTPV